ncbi:hypothetical protein E2C01_059964 [Portunus trituberculatus]|uniref:Secreted protein n=1 Tax=Portunus trituberculatus TaxID=210409 RepID=A0A5B7HA30_PORTR|nr:hypothetical protein [Portunus trituberculatus]
MSRLKILVTRLLLFFFFLCAGQESFPTRAAVSVKCLIAPSRRVGAALFFTITSLSSSRSMQHNTSCPRQLSVTWFGRNDVPRHMDQADHPVPGHISRQWRL